MRGSTPSKPLRDSDDSATDFVREMLKDDPTYGINFDRIQYDAKEQRHVIVELLRAKTRDPHKSHPNFYYWKNRLKFVRLWELALKLDAELWLVNYAVKGSEFSNNVRLMKVLDINENRDLPLRTVNHDITREEFGVWFRKLNRRGNLMPTSTSPKLILKSPNKRKTA